MSAFTRPRSGQTNRLRLALPLVCAPLILMAGTANAQSAPAAPEKASEAEANRETIVVTASRREQNVNDIPAPVEVISEQDVEDSVGAFVTDLLKKNASVDIIEYPGGLSGVGLRGFRPQFSGVNQRVLVLIDGRPAGATSTGNVASAGLSRVEVLKGSASAIYGASAMGGVVNFITRKSEGDIGGNVSVGYGSFNTVKAEANVGGAINDVFSFDIGASHHAQNDDYKLGDGGATYTTTKAGVTRTITQGHGVRRPNTEYINNNFYLRGGAKLGGDWEVQLRVLGFDTPDTETPGAESDGATNQGDKSESNVGGDLSVTGSLGDHKLLALVYHTEEDTVGTTKPPAAREYLNNTRNTKFTGIQLQDSWTITPGFDLIVGGDYGLVENETTAWLQTGAQRGAFSPNFDRRNWGVFGDFTTKLFEDRLILNVGARYDEIESEVLATPLRADLTPGTASYDTVNPRAGLVFRPIAHGPIRIHASAGTGFISPDPSQVAGLTETIVGVQRRLTQGNPNLGPEESESYDLGVGYDGDLFSLDLTWFRMDVKDRISSVIVTNTPALQVTSYQNSLGSRAEGIEAEGYFDFGQLFGAEPGVWSADTSVTYYLTRDEELATGMRTLLNVAELKINFGIGYDDGVRAVKFGARHVSGMEDQDFSLGSYFTKGVGGQFEYDEFTVLDLSARWRLTPHHQIALKADNLLDEYYYEKGDYPFTGRAFHAEYKYSF